MLAGAQPGVLADSDTLRAALRVTLIKDRRDDELFDELFTAFFSLRPVAGRTDTRGHSHGHDDLADTGELESFTVSEERRPGRHRRAGVVHGVRGAFAALAAGAQSRQAGRHQGLLPPGRSRPAVQPAPGSQQNRPRSE